MVLAKVYQNRANLVFGRNQLEVVLQGVVEDITGTCSVVRLSQTQALNQPEDRHLDG